MNDEINIFSEDSGFHLEAERVGERIKNIRGSKGRDDFASQMGVSKSTLNRYESGERTPDAEFLLKLHYLFNASPLWVLSGQGARLRSEKSIRDQIVQTGSSSYKGDVPIPVIDIEVSTGNGVEVGEEIESGHLTFQQKYLSSRGFSAKDLRVVYAKGDSMEPDIQNGAAMLVNTVDTKLDEGCIYVIRVNGNLFAKRVHRGLEGISLLSANKEYPPMNVRPDQLEEMAVLGRVVWSGREH